LLKDPSKHNYKKICGLSDSVIVELMHTSNLQISLIKGQLSQLNSQLDVTVEAIEAHFQSVIDEIIEEVNLQTEKTLRGADNRRNSRQKVTSILEVETEISKKRNDLNSQKSSTERLLDKLKILRFKILINYQNKSFK
jgi:uncharacterized protein (DUF2342 family)